MNLADRSRSKSRRAALVSGLLALFLVSGVVSWLTPDGNLVVTLVPGLAVGLGVFGLVRWRFRRRE
jgi:sugar phosphate permease